MRKILSMLLIVAIMTGIFAVPVFAADAQPLTEHYVNDEGEKISASVNSATPTSKAPMIDGYIYSSQSTETTHVYTENHITYIVGYPDGGVKAEQNMSRSEAVAVLYRLYNGVYPTYTKRMSNNTFADVDSSVWYYKELECLYNVGIVDDSEYFRPDDPITRAEFAVLCARYDNLDYLAKAAFSDVTIGHWAYSYINAAVEAGWIKGYPDGTFKPDNNIIRAEVMALVNRLFNRTPSTKDIVGVANPYNDITTNHWAYCDVIEATVAHDTADWHGISHNDGVVNIIIEKYIDSAGNELAKPVTTQGKTNYHSVAIKGHTYAGYITVITYVYTDGKSIPSIVKTASVSEAEAGDTVTYTVKLSNGSRATAAWEDVVLTDTIPAHMSFTHGSVYIDGKHVDYNYSNGVLTAAVGSIAKGKSATVTFDAVVASTGYGETVYNLAVANGSNGGPVSDTDSGVTISQGEIMPYVAKTVAATANVGDTIIYTLTAGNAKGATYAWENAVITDEIPEGLTFVDGSVYLDGSSAAYTFKDGILKVKLEDIAPNESHLLTFKVTVDEAAYGETIYNVAVGSGSNTPDVEAPDEGVTIGKGTAHPYMTKSSPKTASVGEVFSYTLAFGNNADFAQVAIEDAVISDIIPLGLTFQNASVYLNGKLYTDYSYNKDTRELAINVGTIAVGGAGTITFDVKVNDEMYGKTLENTAIMSADNTIDVEAKDDGISIGTGYAIIENPVKTVSSTTATVGEKLTYEISVTNDRDASEAARNVIVNDLIPAGTSFAGSVQITRNGVTKATTDYGIASGILNVYIDEIAVGETVTVSFEVVVSSYDVTIKNMATIDADNIAEPVNTNEVTTIIGSGSGDGSATKHVSVNRAGVSDTVTYTITLRNAASAAYSWTNIVLVDELPEWVSFVSGSVHSSNGVVNAKHSNGTLSVPVGDIAPGETVIVSFDVIVKAGSEGQFVSNIAVVGSDNQDSIKAPDTGFYVDTGDTSPYDTKTASVTEAELGDRFTYTITLTNGIDATASRTDVIVVDQLPAQLQLVDGSVRLNGKTVSYTVSGQVLTAHIGEILPGGGKVLNFDVIVRETAVHKTLVVNYANISGSNEPNSGISDPGVTIIDPNYIEPDPDTDSDKIPEGAVNDIYVVKKSSTYHAVAQDRITYTVLVGNNMDAVLDDVTVSDELEILYLRIDTATVRCDGKNLAEGKEFSYNNNKLVAKIGTLQPGELIELTFDCKITNDAGGKEIWNTAVATAIDPNGKAVTNRATVATPITVGSVPVPSASEQRQALFKGRGGSGNFDPDANISRDEMAIVMYRMASADSKKNINAWKLSDVESTHWAYTAICWALTNGYMYLESDGGFNPDGDAEMNHAGQFFVMYTDDGTNCGYSGTKGIKRIDFAVAICIEVYDMASANDQDTNGLVIKHYPDLANNYSRLWAVNEVSHIHDWYYNGTIQTWSSSSY